MYILYALACIVAGFLVELNVFKIVRLFGHMEWAERYLGGGGSYTAWRLFGLIGIGAGFWALSHGGFW